MQVRNWLIGLLAVGLLVVGGWWGFGQLSKPLPGEAIAELGRNHATDISNVVYNSDPPTSGPHFPVWAKGGVYDRVISDGHLLHSLEHGYVVISYSCTKSISNFPIRKSQGKQFPISNVYAQDATNSVSASSTPSAKPLTRMMVGVTGGMSFFTPQNPPEAEVELPESFKTDDCKKLVGDLWDIGDNFQRAILVPRPTLDVPIALTAWGRILKLHPSTSTSAMSSVPNGSGLSEAEKREIKDFISVYHNAGPEKTRE